MAFTRGTPEVVSDSAGSGATIQATGVYDQAAGELLVVAVSWENVNATCTVSDIAGSTFTPLTKQRDAASEFSTQLFYCLSCNASAVNVVTASWGVSTPTYRNIAVHRFSYSGSAAFVAESGAAPGSGSTNPNCASIDASDVIVILVKEFAGTNSTPDTGYTEDYDVAANATHGFDKIGPNGTLTPQCTIGTSVQWGIVAASFSNTAGGSGFAVPRNISFITAVNRAANF